MIPIYGTVVVSDIELTDSLEKYIFLKTALYSTLLVYKLLLPQEMQNDRWWLNLQKAHNVINPIIMIAWL